MYENYENHENYQSEEKSDLTKIKIIGVGGAGGNAVNDMIIEGISGVEYVVINTDAQDINKSLAPQKLKIGTLGAGADPNKGRQSAEDNIKEIKEIVKGQDLIFITAGMGGGTGTGAAPVVARVAKEMGILTVAIVTKPFEFEGYKRKSNAEMGLKELEKTVDSLIVIQNEKLFEIEGSDSLSFEEQFKKSNDILRYGIKGISELITKQGYINLDFADIKSVMENSGVALFGYAESREGEEIADYVERAVTNPLLETGIKGAKNILLNITLGKNSTALVIREITRLINEKASSSDEKDINVIFGAITEENRQNVIISIVATGFDSKEKKEEIKKAEETSLFNMDEEESSLLVPIFEKEGE